MVITIVRCLAIQAVLVLDSLLNPLSFVPNSGSTHPIGYALDVKSARKITERDTLFVLITQAEEETFSPSLPILSSRGGNVTLVRKETCER